MRHLVGYTRFFSNIPDELIFLNRTYPTMEDLEAAWSHADFAYLERYFASLGRNSIDFYVLEDLRGRRSYVPIRLLDRIKRIAKGLLVDTPISFG